MWRWVMRYSAPPERDFITPATRDSLVELLDGIRGDLPLATTEWQQHCMEVSIEGIEKGIRALDAGRTVGIAEDEDGIYVAIQVPRRPRPAGAAAPAPTTTEARQ